MINYENLTLREIKKYEKMALKAIRNGNKKNVYEFNGEKTSLNDLCGILDNLDFQYSQKWGNPTGTLIKPSLQCNEKVTQKCEKSVDKPSKNNYINNTNETTTKNSKGDNTMENKINELLTLVKHLTARIESLETGNRPQIKKLRERKEAPKAEKKAVAKKVAAPTDKSEILKLQKKVRESEKTLTKKQLTQYNFFYGQEWRKINKTIDLNDKLARSMAFTKARLNCLKKAKTY